MIIWYDFTTTLRNLGRSGIANVEWNVGRILLERRTDVRPVAMIDGVLVEIDLEVEFAPTAYGAAQRAVPGPRTMNDRLKRLLTERLGPAAPIAIRIAMALNRPRREVASWVRLRSNRPTRATRLPISDRIAADDVVLSLGAVWSSEVTIALSELKRARGCGVAMMVYDLVPLTHTHLAFNKDVAIFEEYYTRLVKTADVITCISRQSERDVHQFAESRALELPPTAPIRLGDGVDVAPADQNRAREDFFLCVGTVERRKNYDVLVDALRIIESEGGEPPRIVVVGAPGWGTDDLVAEWSLQTTKATRAVVFVGAIDDSAIDRLYRRARALLYPSHYEGWGLPVREAAVRGCPVAAGDCDAIREATEGVPGVALLNPDDPDAWADYLRNPTIATEPAPVIEWDQTVDQLLDVLAGAGVLPPPRSPHGNG